MNPMGSNTEGNVDRISDLPDAILEKILSYVPTKNAVATSILSKRWKYLSPFAALPIVLSLCDWSLIHPNENEPDVPSVSFMEFVDKLLNRTLSNVHCVEGMSLRCENDYGDAKILSWVCAALRLNIEWLTLSLPLCDTYGLFVGLNGCTTLVRLALALDSVFLVPDEFSLPNLNILHLSGLDVKPEDSSIFIDIFEGCPALEELWLTDCSLCDLRIESPRLKNFKMVDCSANPICYFFICAPNLEVLELKDHGTSTYDVSKFKSPRAALINVGPSRKQVGEVCVAGSWYFDDNVAKLVIACSNTISLHLAGRSISVRDIDGSEKRNSLVSNRGKALCGSSLQLPEFQNLTWLSFGDIDFDGWALLARLLQNAPNLEKLTMEGFIDNGYGFASFQKSLPASLVCLVICLKRIEFLAFKGDEDEIKLVEYFLKNGEALQELILYSIPPDDASILRRLHMMPRQSKACQIVCLSK